ncbi:hypothetical protein [Terasakiella sp.]|uniref:hypothetical protein n=1 Tax=Terasakiella sp. TaxID=2034861 RepID=UPI003AA88C79
MSYRLPIEDIPTIKPAACGKTDKGGRLYDQQAGRIRRADGATQPPPKIIDFSAKDE